jgi:hypothetical protein
MMNKPVFFNIKVMHRCFFERSYIIISINVQLGKRHICELNYFS